MFNEDKYKPQTPSQLLFLCTMIYSPVQLIQITEALQFSGVHLPIYPFHGFFLLSNHNGTSGALGYWLLSVNATVCSRIVYFGRVESEPQKVALGSAARQPGMKETIGLHYPSLGLLRPFNTSSSPFLRLLAIPKTINPFRVFPTLLTAPENAVLVTYIMYPHRLYSSMHELMNWLGINDVAFECHAQDRCRWRKTSIPIGLL
eukprot:Gb_36302 [translate_table: standard]